MGEDDEELAIREVEAFARLGGQLILELTTPDLGRRPDALVRVSEATGVDIVMGTGRYRSPFYEQDLDRIPTAELEQRFVKDIEEGTDGVRPGVVGEIGTDWDHVTALEERVHRAAAAAAGRTGLTVITHSLGSTVGLAQLDLFAAEGLASDRVAIGHADTWFDRAYHREIADRGAFLIFDTIRGLHEHETQRTLTMLEWAVDGDYSDRVMLGHDVCTTGHLATYGGNGYGFVHGVFADRLVEAGFSREAIEGFLGVNAATFLQAGRAQPGAGERTGPLHE